MTDTAAATAEAPKKRRMQPMLIGVALMVALSVGGFFVTYKRLIPLEKPNAAGSEAGEKVAASAAPAATFVPVPPIIVSLGDRSSGANLRFSSNLEVADGQAAAVKALMPRILDVLNSYLRAVDVSALEDPTALTRLRAQMLRRIQIVTGEGQVRDLLVTQFVLN